MSFSRSFTVTCGRQFNTGGRLCQSWLTNDYKAGQEIGYTGHHPRVGPVTVHAVTKYYSHGGTQVAMRQGDEVYFLHGDHLESTSLTTDQTCTVVSKVRYLLYGEEHWTNGAARTDFTFTGQRAEAGFGLLDYNARYHSPRLGRFISPDTVMPDPTNPQNFNRYSIPRSRTV